MGRRAGEGPRNSVDMKSFMFTEFLRGQSTAAAERPQHTPGLGGAGWGWGWTVVGLCADVFGLWRL